MSGVDLVEVKRLLDFMAKHGLDEFEYEHAGWRVHLRKTTLNSDAQARPAASPRSPEGHGAPASLAAASPLAAATAAAEELHVIKSPIVGTFYGAPNPGAPAFVKLGDQVSAGQILCIIEAMKLMNEIESDVAGVVAGVHVESGQPVEYGAPLFSIRPSGV